MAEAFGAGQEGATVGTLLREGAYRLQNLYDDLAPARLDARVILQHVLGLTHEDIVAGHDDPVSDEAVARYLVLIERRAAGEPVAQLTGTREFWGLPFIVTPDVLCPRPDTETLIELALDLAGYASPRRVLDLGTGSGCLLAALLSHYQGSFGAALDISPAALAVAQRNFEALGLSDRVRLLEGDFADPPGSKFDLIVSNPPYIAEGERDTLPVEVREHEPAVALFAGEDGLDAYRVVAHMLPKALAFRGCAVIEAGAGQAASVRALLEESFAAAGREIEIVTRTDLGGHERAVGLRAEPDNRNNTR